MTTKQLGLLPLLLLPGLLAADGLAAGAGRRVRVLYTGDPYPGVTPYTLCMRVEPLLQVTPVQASTLHYAGISSSDIKRAIRVYMPRTYSSLVESYDVLIISDANVGSFTSEHHAWFKKCVEEGMGFVMVGGYESFGGVAGYPSWGAMPVGDVLPVDVVPGLYWGGPLSVVEKDHVLMRSLPWNPGLPFMQNYECNIVMPRDGSRVLAVVTIGPWGGPTYAGWNNPFFSTWQYRNGTVFTMTGDWTPAGGWLFLRWDYLPDFVTNLMLYCAKRPILQDLSLVHTFRTRIAALAYRRLIATSLVDFIERFGANPRNVLLALREVDSVKEEAANLYLEQNIPDALQAANRALTLMDEVDRVAEKTKQQALLWIYISEWLVVTATLLLCGLLVWALMIRHRLYREVAITKLGAG